MNRLFCFLLALALGVSPAWANFTATQGSGITVVAVDGSNQGTSACAAGSTECPATILMDSTGTILSVTSHVLNTNAALNAAPSLANGNGVVLAQGGAVLSATNPIFVSPATSALFANNLTQVDSTALGAPVAWGSTPTGVVLSANVNCITGCSAAGTTFAQGGATAPTNASLVGGTFNSSAPSLSNGQSVGLQVTSAGSLHATVDNTNTNIGNNADSVAPAATSVSPVGSFPFVFDGTNWDRARGTTGGVALVTPQASAAGGALSGGPLYSAASNNATNVKASAGTLYSVTVTQSTTTAMELKLYNLATSPTCSSATGIVANIPIPSNATAPGFHLTYPVGRAFSTGIAFCLVAFGAPASSTDNGNAVTGATVDLTYD